MSTSECPQYCSCCCFYCIVVTIIVIVAVVAVVVIVVVHCIYLYMRSSSRHVCYSRYMQKYSISVVKAILV